MCRTQQCDTCHVCPGVYRAVGVANGRYVYQREGRDRYLEYTAAGDWMVTESVGGDTGHVSHLGGSVCPEHAAQSWDTHAADTWTHDPGLRYLKLSSPRRKSLD